MFVLALAGCAPAARPAEGPPALYVPPLRTPASQTGPLPVRFAEGAAPPSGCFGVSRRTGAIACLVGQYALASAAGERRVTVLANSDQAVPDLPVRVRTSPHGVELEPASRRALDALMLEGDFVALGTPDVVPVESTRALGGLVVELRRVGLTPEDGLPPRPARASDLRVVVRVDAPDADGSGREADTTTAIFENTLSSVTCTAPSLTVRVLEPTVVLLERECRLDEGGEPEVVAGAWLCNSEHARCD
ncbi:MAG: hypothetical protein KF764_20755 [Labilithrix sp.]|nr:hypothetical protein [Labilithrix sp.]